MIIPYSINLKELFEMGRDYPWKKPSKCAQCGCCRIWGHGFVFAFFDYFDEALLLKRYRCPDCRAVFRCRPSGYFSRFQVSIDTIRRSIESKSQKKRWFPGISRTRQRHWYRALLRHICAYFGNAWRDGALAGFDELLSRGLVPVTRSI